jgi:hypothetical protein
MFSTHCNTAVEITNAAKKVASTKSDKDDVPNSIRHTVTGEKRMASMPDDLYAKWVRVNNMLFADGATGLYLYNADSTPEMREVNGQYRNIVFVTPHPVAQDRKQSVWEQTKLLYNLPYTGLKWLLDSIMNGSILPQEHLTAMRIGKYQPMPFHDFWKNIVTHFVARYKCFATIHYWLKLLVVAYGQNQTEMETKLFKIKLDDYSTWISDSTPTNIKIMLNSYAGVKPASVSEAYITRGVEVGKYRPNKLQMQAMVSCLQALDVPYKKDVSHDERGLLPFRVDMFWDNGIYHPLPYWKPPNPLDDPSVSQADAEKQWPEGSIVQDTSVILDASAALGGSPNVMTLYRGWKEYMERMTYNSRAAKEGSIAQEAAARADNNVLGEEQLLIKTQTNLPMVLPSNALLVGKYNPFICYEDDVYMVAFFQRWILNMTVLMKLRQTPPVYPDPVNATVKDLYQDGLKAVMELQKVLDPLLEGKEVPKDLIPEEVRL